jgi:hypothetical protein
MCPVDLLTLHPRFSDLEQILVLPPGLRRFVAGFRDSIRECTLARYAALAPVVF